MSLSQKNRNYKIEERGRKVKRIKIRNITIKNEKTKVYNLQVQKPNENFFANRLLVHNCSLGCMYCVPAKTKILMANGRTKCIEEIREGESVISLNQDTQEFEASEVTTTMKRISKEIITIFAGNKTLSLTPEHPILIKNKGWVEASNIKKGDEVLIW